MRKIFLSIVSDRTLATTFTGRGRKTNCKHSLKVDSIPTLKRAVKRRDVKAYSRASGVTHGLQMLGRGSITSNVSDENPNLSKDVSAFGLSKQSRK
jgi:hypothetical protein